MTLSGTQIIAGEFRAAGRDRAQKVSPVTGETLPVSFAQATAEEVDEAAGRASLAWPAYRRLSPTDRARFLRRIASEIEELGEALIERCHLETGLSTGRLEGERGRTCSQLRLFADVVEEGSWVDARITTSLPGRTPAPRPDIRRMLVALGPVVVFGASNFPLAFSVAGGDTASALAAGCPVIVKAHSSHPGTSELVGRAIVRAADAERMPPGVFSLLHGPGTTVGIRLVEHAEITAVGFTGSYTGGRALFDAAARRPKPIPVYAEMGSINPVFVLPGAARTRGDEIAAGLTGSVTLGVGQFCTNPGLVVGIGGADFDAFAAATGRQISGVDAGIMLNRRIQQAYTDGIDALRTKVDVEQLAVGRSADGDASGPTGQAALFRTRASALLGDRSLSEEVFGPSTLLVAAEDRDELVRVATELTGHLTCTIHGTEEDLAGFSDLIDVLGQKAGRLIFNGYPTGVEVCHAMTHGGPFPATTDPHFTSVGTAAMLRFARPVSWQDFPEAALPAELQAANPTGILRLVDGDYTRDRLV
jgi:2,5-dioxopentanoate dehydrogenase